MISGNVLAGKGANAANRIPGRSERLAAAVASAAAPDEGVPPGDIPFFGQSIPGLVPMGGIFRQAHDSGAMR